MAPGRRRSPKGSCPLTPREVRLNLFARYARWLHTGFPAGRVEKLPFVDEQGPREARRWARTR